MTVLGASVLATGSPASCPATAGAPPPELAPGPPRRLWAPVVLACTHERTLDVVPLEALREHAVDVPDDLGNL
jgi:hypothetical protein